MRREEVTPRMLTGTIEAVLKNGERTKEWISLPIDAIPYGKNPAERESLAKFAVQHIKDESLFRFDESKRVLKMRTRSQAVKAFDGTH